MSIPTAIIICIIISSPFIWTLVRKFYKLKEKSFCSFFKTIFLDELSLHKQPLFWLLIASPVIISVTLWAIISPEYKLEWTAHGYAGLIKYGQLPLTILTLSPILGAFVISAHRSIQTEVQIKTSEKQLVEAQKKNKIDMYISNKNYILKELKLIKVGNYKIEDRNSLYRRSFININTYEVIRNEKFYTYSEKLLDVLNSTLKTFISKGYKDILNIEDEKYIESNYCYSISLNANSLLRHLNIKTTKVFNELPRKQDLYHDEIINSHIDNHQDIPNNIDADVLNRMIGDIECELENIVEVVKQTLFILSDFENIDKIILGKIEEVESTIGLMYSQIGDKLAAENQNPPE